MASVLNLSVDEALTTTRAVRKRLDLTRPVDLALVKECLEIAVQAPTGSNQQNWHFLVVTEQEQRRKLADLYRRAFERYRGMPFAAGNIHTGDSERDATQQRVMSSAEFLAEHLEEVPVHVIPCVEGRFDEQPAWVTAAITASVIPAAWSFMIAARVRGLGTSWTTMHLMHEREAAEIFGVPYERVAQIGLIPVAHSKGTDFKRAPREPLEQVLHIDRW